MSHDLYILELEDSCWYVGVTKRGAMVRFNEHCGKPGLYTAANFCKEHEPVGTKPMFYTSVTQWLSKNPGWRAEDLERNVTAQLVLLCGVNRVRGGEAKRTKEESDLLYRYSYSSNDDDMNLVTKKVAGPLGFEYNRVRTRINELMNDEECNPYPLVPTHIRLDHNWKVVADGYCLDSKSLHHVPYVDQKLHQVAAMEHAHFPFNAVPVVHQLPHASVPMENVWHAPPPVSNVPHVQHYTQQIEPMVTQTPDDVNVPLKVSITAFLTLGLSTAVLAFCVFLKAFEAFSAYPSWMFFYIGNGILFGISSILMIMRERKLYKPIPVLIALFTIGSSILTCFVIFKMSHAKIWISKSITRVPYELIIFQVTFGNSIAAALIVVWNLALRNWYNIFPQFLLGCMAHAGIIAAFFFLKKIEVQTGPNEFTNVNMRFAAAAGALSVMFTLILVKVLEKRSFVRRETHWMRNTFYLILAVPSAFPFFLSFAFSAVLLCCFRLERR